MGFFSRELDADTLTRPVEQEDDGGHDRFAHYVKKEKVVESAVTVIDFFTDRTDWIFLGITRRDPFLATKSSHRFASYR